MVPMNNFVPINQPIYGKKEIDLINNVIKSGFFTVSAYSKEGGYFVTEFERKVANYVGKSHAVTVSSGTTALRMALIAANIGHNSNVVIPSLTFVATANAVRSVGAQVIFCDVNHEGLLDEDELRKISKEYRIDAIIPVNLFGRVPKTDYKGYGATVIEDACQSLGTKGTGYGHLTCISFYASKIITTAGAGGIILTDDDILADGLRLARNQGIEGSQCVTLGTNELMGEINAAFGCAQMQRLDGFIKKRRSNMKYLDIQDNTNGYLGAITRANRDSILSKLRELKIGATVYYDRPIHKHPFYYRGEDLPMTDYLAEQLLSVPVHPNVTKETLDKIKGLI